jgi:membrane associated rhomboid family serine protease
MALCARAGQWPKLRARDLLKPLLVLLGCMAILSLAAGACGYLSTSAGPDPFVDWALPPEKRAAFYFDAWAHAAAYGAGFLGGLCVCGIIIRRRKLEAQQLRSSAI